MALQECKICGEEFDAEDDEVVCPECMEDQDLDEDEDLIDEGESEDEDEDEDEDM